MSTHNGLAATETQALEQLTEVSPRSRIRRHPDRSVPEQAEQFLRIGRVAHVAFVVDGQPFVLPFTYHYEAGTLYLHGARASRTLRTLRPGMPVCVEVTLLDGLIASRDAESHSANYRSVIVFGRAEAMDDLDEKRALLERMTQRYFPGRSAGKDYLPATVGELRAVELLAVEIEELSAKSRSGPPAGKHDRDGSVAGSSYVVMLGGHDA